MRNKIDEGLKDAWEGTKNVAKDVASEVADKAGDAWDAVTPW